MNLLDVKGELIMFAHFSVVDMTHDLLIFASIGYVLQPNI